METKLLKHDEIDQAKWDACIRLAENGLIYAESEYLNHMAEGWWGIVADDYKAVMPLCQRSKLGFRYLYQPAFCQQGGIFYTAGTLKEYEETFLQLIEDTFLFVEITLNFGHDQSSTSEIKRKSSNYLRTLSEEAYNPYIITRLKRAQKFCLTYRSSNDVEGILSSYQELYASRIQGIKKSDFENLHLLCKKMQEKGRVILREVYDAAGKEVLASCLLLTDRRRIYNIINNLFPAGRAKMANYILFQNIFSEFKNSGKIFDFEGSDLEGVGYFYKKFSTNNQPFFPYRINRLPSAIRWIKE